MATKYLVEIERENCIGCAACVSVCAKFWKMESDNKSSLIGGKKQENGWEALEVEEADFECNNNAANSCPVNVIHITNKGNGDKII